MSGADGIRVKRFGLLLLVMAMCQFRIGAATTSYHGFFADDWESVTGLRNPERGYRMMTEVGESGKTPVNAIMRDWRGQLAKYPEQSIAQAYCWLTDYCDRPIDEDKIAAIRSDLTQLREAGVKVLLRFAYERSMPPTKGPGLETTLRHMEQLQPLLAEFSDTIFVLQLGFVGAFGEWHNSYHHLNENPAATAIVDRLFEIMPAGRKTHMRVPRYKRMVLGTPELQDYTLLGETEAFSDSKKSRIGFDNDGFGAGESCGGTWTEAPLFSNPGNPEFDMMTIESAWVPVDGEMYFGDLTDVEGYWAAKRLRLHHYTTFGMFQGHAYVEEPEKKMPHSMDKWKLLPVTEEQLRADHMPISDNYFLRQDGTPASRSVFEYIRDHLGYRLELQTATLPETLASGETLEVELTLINRGFSAPVYARPVYLALVDAQAKMTALPLEAEPRQWQPYQVGDTTYTPLTHVLTGSLTLPPGLPPGEYRIGLWLPDPASSLRHDPQYAIRLANRDIEWLPVKGRYGVNVFGHIRIDGGDSSRLR